MSIKKLDELKLIRNGAAITQRLEWLEGRIFWVGELKRADLIERFGISIQQASSDIRLYQELAPNNLQYDGSIKRYLKAELASPLFEQSPETWLYSSSGESSALRTIQRVTIDVVKPDIQANVLMHISRAYHKRKPISILYQSRRNELPVWRTICPHSIVDTNIRPHIRAWQLEKKEFGDIVPNRIIKIKDANEDIEWIGEGADTKWNTLIDIRIIPSKQRTELQRQAIERDYKMINGILTIPTRMCLVYYQLSAMYLVDAVRQHQGEPLEYNIGLAVHNWQDLRQYVMD